MLALILSLLKPLGDIFSSFFSAFFSTETAKVQAGAAVETESIKATAAVETKWWFVAALIPLFAIPYVIYVWKAIAWDKVIGPWFGYHNRTDLINGPLGWVFTTIVVGLFLHSLSTK